MRYALFICLLICLWPTFAKATQANGCFDFVQPSISIHQLDKPPTYDHTANLSTLMSLATSGGKEFSGMKHDVPVGLTAASLKLDSHFEVRIRINRGSKMVCAQIEKFDLGFGFDDTVVYLASEVPYGTCGYNTVMNHELQHVQIDRNFVRSYLLPVKELLRKAVASVGVVRASTPDAAEKQITKKINLYLSSLGATLSNARQQQQMQIDTQKEYDRLGKSCNGSLSQLISAAQKKSNNSR